MPSYKKYLIAASLLLAFSGCSNEVASLDTQPIIKKDFITVEQKEFPLENQYIIFALEYENQKEFNTARDVYYRLFLKTNNYEYLVRFLSISLQLNDLEAVKTYSAKHMLEGIKEEEFLLRFYSLSLFRLKEYDLAIKNTKKLISKFKRDINLELLGTIYLQQKDFTNSIKYFKEAYLLGKSERALLSLTNVMYFYGNDKNKAKEYLEEYVEDNSYVYNLCIQLLTFYEREKDDDKIISLLKNMYYEYKNDLEKDEILQRTKSLLIRYLAKRDINETVEFFEKEGNDKNLLLALYRSANKPKKAMKLLNELYDETKNLDYLAQIAILEFELASNKEEVLNSVIEKFKKALEVLDNPMYQNYLAYLLIDYDRDIKEGLKLVKKALEKEPKNLAYIDTLAWGEYKANNCEVAYIEMKKVVDKAGLKDKEIKLHWDKIKECTK